MHRLQSLGVCASVLLSAGCGSWTRPGKQPAPAASESFTEVLDINSVYRRLGRLTAGEPLPFVADVAFFAGEGDSTVALMGLSLENQNLAFEREGDVFVARYRVELSAQPVAGGRTVESAKDQVVKVSTFAETQRSDESILYQDGLTLQPGNWKISVQVTDHGLGKASHVEAGYHVPSFPPGSISSPRLAYQVRGRSRRSAPVAIILNPRGTLAYGMDTALAYVEGYQLPGPTAVPVRMFDSRDSLVLADTLRFAGNREVESEVVRFAPDSAALGELHILVGTPPHVDSTVAIVSFSVGWVVTNFDDMISLLRYFPDSPALDSLRKAPASERARLWKSFYHSTDPNPATPVHEELDAYFARLAIANVRFRGEGVPGWRTERGEALIRLGEPDEVYDASAQSQGRLIRWEYTQYQLVLYFVDESGFGRYRLTPSSRAEMDRVVARLSRGEG
ncbi:MAG TPA: GWxTD domain-containing protein [Gemmatimonadales bacterium]|nr:GWxTD domain-containing protein [Gemmatimonadales bacterium]